MTRVVVVPAAAEDLARLIVTHSLPADTNERVKRSLRPLADFPLLGAPLENRWDELRFLLGPWRWLLILYAYDREQDVVSIVSFQDGRAFGAPTR
ncbi:MAG TPA: type II toxin-antitoxin system RelE/ParE family toxin [Gaiellaceae bacterium]